jgi:CheY-like chemotaxis protein
MNGDTTKTAVVADDDPEVRLLLAEYLDRLGYQVTEARDGLETLLQVKKVRPTLLILDLMMPRLGGIDALEHIRKHFPDVVVVVLTGTPDDKLRGRAVSLGAAALLPKPLDLDVLGTILSTVVVPPATAPARPTPQERPATAGRPTVLVADDEEDMRAVLQEFLEAQTYRVLLAPDGLTALRTVIDERPEVVLLDIQMPRLGGVEALTAIRAIAPETRVIMISGVDDVGVARGALAHGAFDYLRKPLNYEYLQHSLEVALELRF